MFQFMLWADTTSGLLKIRNAANTDWVTIGTLASANLGLAVLAANTFTGTQDPADNPLQRAMLLDSGATVHANASIRRGMPEGDLNSGTCLTATVDTSESTRSEEARAGKVGDGTGR